MLQIEKIRNEKKILVKSESRLRERVSELDMKLIEITTIKE